MASKRKKLTAEEVEARIAVIEAYHRQGCQSLLEWPRQNGDCEAAIARQARPLGWNVTKLRKARQFADPDTGYTRTHLDKLFTLLRRHRPNFGTAFIGTLVTVSWQDGRAELQRRCIQENWSKSELNLEVKSQFGPRRKNGRRQRIGNDPTQVLTHLDGMADSWQRWFKEATRNERGDDGRRSLFDDLPGKVRDSVHVVNVAVQKLREVLEEERDREKSRLSRAADV